MRAAGEVGIGPQEFWRLTGWELNNAIEGRSERQFYIAALHASWTMAPHTTTRVTPDMLLGKDEPAQEFGPLDSDPESIRKFMDARQREAEEKQLQELEDLERARASEKKR